MIKLSTCSIEISTIYILPHLDQLGLIYFSALTISKDKRSYLYLPGSHQFEKFPGIQYAEKNKIQVVAKLERFSFNAMLFHRAGRNLSTF